MKQYTNAYRRIPVYAYQFMAGPALGPRGVYSRGRQATCGRKSEKGGELPCGVAGGV